MGSQCSDSGPRHQPLSYTHFVSRQHITVAPLQQQSWLYREMFIGVITKVAPCHGVHVSPV